MFKRVFNVLMFLKMWKGPRSISDAALGGGSHPRVDGVMERDFEIVGAVASAFVV
jgi:hypothetical protein